MGDRPYCRMQDVWLVGGGGRARRGGVVWGTGRTVERRMCGWWEVEGGRVEGGREWVARGWRVGGDGEGGERMVTVRVA